MKLHLNFLFWMKEKHLKYQQKKISTVIRRMISLKSNLKEELQLEVLWACRLYKIINAT